MFIGPVITLHYPLNICEWSSANITRSLEQLTDDDVCFAKQTVILFGPLKLRNQPNKFRAITHLFTILVDGTS